MLLLAMILTPLAVPRYWMVVLGAGLYGGLAFFVAIGDALPMPYVRSEFGGVSGSLAAAARDGLQFLAVGTVLYWGKRGLFYALGRRRPKVLSNID